jgi:hypothetical protein
VEVIMAKWSVGTALVWCVVTGGCSGVPELPEMIGGDWQPPILTAVEARSGNTVALVFDEPVELREVTFEAPVAVTAAAWEEEGLVVTTDTDLAPGDLYWIDARVEDESGNMSSVLVSVYGLNPELPEVLINEFVCEGTGRHADWVELLVLTDGNLGGLTLYEGSPGIWDSRYVFPAMDVAAGDFIIVHFKPEVIPEEINETDDKGASGGNNSSDDAWDVWVAGGDGIPNTTGALTLTRHPAGDVMDAVLYTTKRYDASHQYRGFGLKSQLEMMEELVALGCWKISGTEVIPEDLVDPEDSTSTRSINRTPGAPDTDSPADWHIGPTSSGSPGRENTVERYEG